MSNKEGNKVLYLRYLKLNIFHKLLSVDRLNVGSTFSPSRRYLHKTKSAKTMKTRSRLVQSFAVDKVTAMEDIPIVSPNFIGEFTMRSL